MELAITQIILGALVIAAMVCPAPCSNVVLGVVVLRVGILQFIGARKTA